MHSSPAVFSASPFMRTIMSMNSLSSLFCNCVLQFVHVINSYSQDAQQINAGAMQGRRAAHCSYQAIN